MLTIYTSTVNHPEKAYIFHVLFREILGVEFKVIPDDANQHRIVLPGGAELIVNNQFQGTFTASSAPTPESIPGQVPHPFQTGENIIGVFGDPHFEVSDQRIFCGLDLFASAFFMLTRWEEDAPQLLDKHQRFPAEQSLAFKANFLDRPVVNEWAELIWQMLVRLGWQKPRKTRQYQLSISCDVDHPRLWWSTADRLRTLGGAVFKRGNPSEALYFAENHLFKEKDPYDVFDEWLELFGRLGHRVQFNFLGARPKGSDCWYPLDHPFIKNLLVKISEHGHCIGFHPGYEAFENKAAFRRELATLRAVSPLEITSGRQHYLRFKVPETWRMWQEAGLSSDSTLGYPEAAGFRCGICHDYPVFDLKTREMLSLREQPLIAMDMTLAGYCRFSPEVATQRLLLLRQQVEKHGGDFTLLWHYSSWNTVFWEPWKHVFVDFIS